MNPRPLITLPEAAELQPIGAGRVLATKAKTDAALLTEGDRGYDGHSRRAYQRIGGRFLDALAMPLRQAAIEDYRRAVAFLAIKADGSEASQSTKATYTAAVKSFLGFAHGVGYIAFNAAPFIKIEKAQRDLAKRIIEDVDVKLLIRAAAQIGSDPLLVKTPAAERDRLLIEVGYYGGLRVSELVSLKWGDLLVRGKGQLQIASLVGKGGKVREVLLPAGVSGRLTMARRDALDDDPIFKSQRHDGPISERAALNIIKAAARRAGLSDRISPHWLRHAHISHALDNGAPVSLVSQSVGHADMKTTSIYAHARPGDSSGLYLKDLTLDDDDAHDELNPNPQTGPASQKASRQ